MLPICGFTLRLCARSLGPKPCDSWSPQVGGLGDDRGCLTDGFFLVGAGGWSPTLFIRLIQDYGFDIDVSKLIQFVVGWFFIQD